jgi:hypothetical protein
LGESLGDGGRITGVSKAVCTSPSLGFGLFTDQVINIGKDFLKLVTEKLNNEGSREVEDEDLEKSPM